MNVNDPPDIHVDTNAFIRAELPLTHTYTSFGMDMHGIFQKCNCYT